MRELGGTADDFFKRNDPTFAEKSLERDNVRIVEELYRSIEQGDVAAFQNLLTNDIQLEIIGPKHIPFTGVACGQQPVVDFVVHNFGLLEEQNARLLEVIAQGHSVVVFGCETGKFRGCPEQYQLSWVQRFNIRGKQVEAIKQVFDTAALHGFGTD